LSVSSVGFVGLGRMGFGMASNLSKAGVPLTVCDLSPEPLNALAAQGVSIAADPAEVAASVDLLFICVPSDAESEAVLFGHRGATTGKTALPVIDTTTMNHGAALRLWKRAQEEGFLYSDCPISGMPFRAADGTLTMMFGGSQETFADARPYLDTMGEFIVHCGDVGMGQLMKAVNNIIYDVNIAAICEVMPLAVKAGLRPETLAEVLTTASSRSFASEYFVPRILEGRFDGDFSLRSAFKDIVNVQEVAARLEASLPVVDAMVSTYQAAIDQGFGEESKSAMVKVYEDSLGQKVRRPASTDSADG